MTRVFNVRNGKKECWMKAKQAYEGCLKLNVVERSFSRMSNIPERRAEWFSLLFLTAFFWQSLNGKRNIRSLGSRTPKRLSNQGHTCVTVHPRMVASLLFDKKNIFNVLIAYSAVFNKTKEILNLYLRFHCTESDPFGFEHSEQTDKL